MAIPSRLPALLAALREETIVVTRTEIIEHFGENAYNKGRLDGSIARILPGFYVHRNNVEKLNTRLAACTRWAADGEAISGLAACHAHGLQPQSIPHVSLVLGIRRQPRVPSWIRARTLAHIPPTSEASGWRVVPLEHALIDAVSEHGVDAVMGLIIDAIRENKTDAVALLATLEALPRVTYRRRLIRFLAALKGGIQSYLEHLADTAIFNVPDLGGLERQVVFVVDGKKYRVDAYDRNTKTAIELDGRKHHGSEEARRRDLKRDAALASIGIQTLRFTYEQVRDRPSWCRRIIQDTISARTRRITR